MSLAIAELETPMPIDRRTYLGGSDAAAIFGVSPWTTPLDLYLKKTGPEEKPDPKKEAVYKRGHRWEPVALDMLLDALEDQDGQRPKLLARNQRYTDHKYHFLQAEIDAEIEYLGEVVNVELKTVHPFKAHEWGEEGSEEVPIHYAAQTMHGLAVTGRRLCIVGALFGADTIIPFRIARDEETIQAMRQKSVAFWKENVRARVPPEPVNIEDIMRLFAATKGRPVTVTDEIAGMVRQRTNLKQQMKTFEAQADELEFQVCDYVRKAWGVVSNEELEDNAILIYDGRTIGTWKRQQHSSLDQTGFKETHPALHEEYMRRKWIRVLRAK